MLAKGLFIALGLVVAAGAEPVTWSITGTFDDGGAISGTFDYDADTNTYNNVNIVTTPGSNRTTGALYTTLSVGLSPNQDQALVVTSTAPDQTGNPATALFFSIDLTDFGGTVSVIGQEASCGDSACMSAGAPERYITSSSASIAGSSEILLQYFLFQN